MNPARVTVSIPTFNRATMLCETIASVQAQSFTDFEILICDNASTDETVAMLARFASSRLKLHRHATNIGMQGNWKFALTQPTTEYVALLSDDDLFLPPHLEAGVQAMDCHPSAVMYACAAETFGTQSGVYCVPAWARGAQGVVEVRAEDRYWAWLKNNPVASCALIIRRSAFNHVAEWGGKNWPVSMDWLWWAQIAMGGLFLYDTAVGVKYRLHATNYYKTWSSRRSLIACENHYTIRTLANLALRRGLLDIEALEQAALNWSAPEAARLIVALLAPEAHPALRQMAMRLRHEHPEVRKGLGSRHVQLAHYVGGWYLRCADRLLRYVASWPPLETP